MNNGWRDWDSVPNDGTDFLFNAPDLECGVSIGYIDKSELRSSFDGKKIGYWVTKPTHWQPLPKGPNE